MNNLYFNKTIYSKVSFSSFSDNYVFIFDPLDWIIFHLPIYAQHIISVIFLSSFYIYVCVCVCGWGGDYQVTKVPYLAMIVSLPIMGLCFVPIASYTIRKFIIYHSNLLFITGAVQLHILHLELLFIIWIRVLECSALGWEMCLHCQQLFLCCWNWGECISEPSFLNISRVFILEWERMHSRTLVLEC